jgi:uncharacterized protein (TIGR03067 family)
MNAALLLGLAVGVSAPALKDPPPKTESIVGEWVIESVTLGGKAATSAAGIRYEYTADGQQITRGERGRKTNYHSYKVDPKADPPTIDMSSPASGPELRGIYKVEGDSLVFCFGFDADSRPTRFESPDGSRLILMVLKRVKKKD